MDPGAGDPGVVIDHGVDKRVFHQFVAVLVARPSQSRLAIPVALLTADEPPATAVRNVAQLLDVDVDERVGVGMLVTTCWFPRRPVDVGELVQSCAGEDATDCGGCDPGPGRELDRAFTELDASIVVRRWF